MSDANDPANDWLAYKGSEKNMRTEAAVAYPQREGFAHEPVEIAAPNPDEILVRVLGVGLCHTDLVFATGAGGYPLPAVLGHEGAGIVEQVGAAVTKVKPGDKVVMTFRSCGACDRCASGDAAYCRTMPQLNYAGMRTDGTSPLSGEAGRLGSNFFGQSSFAGLALTYERNVVKVNVDIETLRILGPLGCGVQTGVGAMLNSMDVRPGSTVLVLGGGSVGLSGVIGAKLRECAHIIVVEPQASRRALALELGATETIDPKEAADLSAAIREKHPFGVDYAFETTGAPAVLNAAAACLGSKGVLGVVGICPPGTPPPGEMISMVTFGQSIRGIIEGDSDPDVFIPELISLFKAGRLPFDKMVRTYPLNQINQAIRDQHEGRCIKAVLLPQ